MKQFQLIKKSPLESFWIVIPKRYFKCENSLPVLKKCKDCIFYISKYRESIELYKTISMNRFYKNKPCIITLHKKALKQQIDSKMIRELTQTEALLEIL